MFPLIATFLAAAIAYILYLVWHKWRLASPTSVDASETKGSDAAEKSPYEAIEPLRDFDWRSTQPIKVWPFKPKYHLTMGLENLPFSDFIEMDSTYLDRMRLRREILDEHPLATKQCNKVAETAVLELYDWMVRTYLPRRYPTIYKPSYTSTDPTGTQSPHLLNTVSQTTIPFDPASPMAALDTLGAHVDTDFLILLPSSHAADGSPIYHLEAFVTCFPSGFSTREKCGQALASIHKPVPGYESKLEKSMDRFFARLEVGKLVKRSNWSVTTNDLLYSEGGNHLYENDEDNPFQNAKTLDVEAENVEQDVERQRAEVVVEKCRLRCERQTLHRLPQTKALVFAFKTYQYLLSEVKEAGLGPTLAEAIEGLAKGSVPDMAFYKRQVVWGDKAIEYLQS